MTITVNAVGTERKRLVNTISTWMGTPAIYCGAPTFNYKVDGLTIGQNGSNLSITALSAWSSKEILPFWPIVRPSTL